VGLIVCLGITSSEVIWLCFEPLWPERVPVLHRLQGRSGCQSRLRQLLIIERYVTQNGLLEVLAALEPMALHDVLDATIEALDHAVRLRSHRRVRSVLAAKFGA